LGAVFLSELAPVITVGRRECSQDLLLPEEVLRAQGVELYPTDRGGRATYHGPGQWVVFVVDHLERLTGDRRGVRKAVEALLELACEVGRSFLGSAVEIRSGDQTGVWTPRGKLASVGVQIDRGVLLHGLAINGFKTPQSFLGIRPCGLDAQVDFLLDSTRPEQASREFEGIPSKLIQGIESRFWVSR
jgi:lipoyl(octanoyl) transferase